jgi:hypothetical protein
MTKASNNPFPSILVAKQASAPSTPASGYGRIYCKSDGLYFIGDNGTEVGPFATSSGGGYTQGARVYNSASQAIASATTTYIAWNSESYDTDGIHDTATNNSRLTCKTAGKYTIAAHVNFSANANGIRRGFIHLNRTTVICDIQIEPVDLGRGVTGLILTTLYDLQVNDYVEFAVIQDSGSSLNVTVDTIREAFMMQRIG